MILVIFENTNKCSLRKETGRRGKGAYNIFSSSNFFKLIKSYCFELFNCLGNEKCTSIDLEIMNALKF